MHSILWTSRCSFKVWPVGLPLGGVRKDFDSPTLKCVVALALDAKDYSGRKAFTGEARRQAAVWTKTKGKNDWSVSILSKPEM